MSTYIFGYGALINIKNIKEIKYNKNRTICPVSVTGLKRTFNVISQNGQYKVLGVKDTPNKKQHCNGVLIKINTAEELAHLITREKKYEPKWLNPKRILFNYDKKIKLNPADHIIYFYPTPPNTLTQKAAKELDIRPNYLNNCLAGARDFGDVFLRDFIQTIQM